MGRKDTKTELVPRPSWGTFWGNLGKNVEDIEKIVGISVPFMVITFSQILATISTKESHVGSIFRTSAGHPPRSARVVPLLGFILLVLSMFRFTFLPLSLFHFGKHRLRRHNQINLPSGFVVTLFYRSVANSKVHPWSNSCLSELSSDSP